MDRVQKIIEDSQELRDKIAAILPGNPGDSVEVAVAALASVVAATCAATSHPKETFQLFLAAHSAFEIQMRLVRDEVLSGEDSHDA